MKIKLSSVISSLFYLIIFTHCKKSSSTPVGRGNNGGTDSAGAGHVYVAGHEYVNGSDIRTAEYWKDGKAVALTDGKNHAEGWAIAVVGNDVYVAGCEQKNGVPVAKYWKNGTAVALDEGITESKGSSIAVAGNDVYVAGYVTDNKGVYRATIWKNGVATSFQTPYGEEGTYATGISVVGNDVYVVGYAYTSLDTQLSTAVCWKNGVLTALTDGTDDAANKPMPTYWKNDTKVTLSKDYSGEARAIVVK